MKRSPSFDADQDLRRIVRPRPSDLPRLFSPTTPDPKHSTPAYPCSIGTSVARSSSPLSSSLVSSSTLSPFQEYTSTSVTIASSIASHGGDPTPQATPSKYEQRRHLKASNELAFIATLRVLRDVCPVCFVMLRGQRCDDHDAPDCSIIEDVPRKFRRWISNVVLLPGSCYVCWAPRRSPTDPPGLRHGMPNEDVECELLHLTSYFCWAVYENYESRQLLFYVLGLPSMDEDEYKMWLVKANPVFNFNFAQVVVKMFEELEQ